MQVKLGGVGEVSRLLNASSALIVDYPFAYDGGPQDRP